MERAVCTKRGYLDFQSLIILVELRTVGGRVCGLNIWLSKTFSLGFDV